MSRNFELLQSLGKAPELGDAALATGAEPEPIATVPPLQMGELKPLSLNMDEDQRDQVEKLVQRVFLLPGQSAARLVGFSGTEPGNGCSWICARAAETLASQTAGTVCVVDANLRSPSLHECFAVENHHGLSNSLMVPDPLSNFLHPLGQNLWFLSCGPETSIWQPLLNSDRMRSRLTELRGMFDYVLVDSPALSLGNDAVSLARRMEGLVLVLKANSSRRESVRKSVQDLDESGVRVLGAVLNQRTFPIPQKLYRRL